MLEYDIFQPRLRRFGNFESDPTLKILRNSKNTEVFILLDNLEGLLVRIKKNLNIHNQR